MYAGPHGRTLRPLHLPIKMVQCRFLECTLSNFGRKTIDRLSAMSTVLETVDAGSLSATGRQLSVPLATISRRVSDLEAYLGTQIFIRASRRPPLTEAGRARTG